MCFFFQAEDGIRDVAVTGVQTCALPISWFARASHYRRGISRPLAVRTEIDDGARAEVRRAFRRARNFSLLLHGHSLGNERAATLAGASAHGRTDRRCAGV